MLEVREKRKGPWFPFLALPLGSCESLERPFLSTGLFFSPPTLCLVYLTISSMGQRLSLMVRTSPRIMESQYGLGPVIHIIKSSGTWEELVVEDGKWNTWLC